MNNQFCYQKVLSLIQAKQQIKKSPTKGYLRNYSLHEISPPSSPSKKLLGEERNTHQIANIKIVSKQHIKASLQTLNQSENIQNFNYIKLGVSLIQEQAAKWKQLKHRNILKFYDFIETNKDIFLFSQYAEGMQIFKLLRTLGKYIQTNNLSLLQSLQIMRQLIEAVVYLHSNQIYNANISPQNIYCSLYQPLVLKIGELGTTPILLSETVDVTYRAPQYFMNKNGSKKADIWSLGGLPWQLNSSYTTKMYNQKQIQQPPKYPTHSNKPPSIKFLINDMLEYNHQKRISIKDLRQEFFKLYFTFSRT